MDEKVGHSGKMTAMAAAIELTGRLDHAGRGLSAGPGGLRAGLVGLALMVEAEALTGCRVLEAREARETPEVAPRSNTPTY